MKDDTVELGAGTGDGAPVHASEPGRLPWLREGLAKLAESLGRVPTTAELSAFLRRYRVERAELDGLLDMGRSDVTPRREASTTVPSPLELRTARPSSTPTAMGAPRPAGQAELSLPSEASACPPSDGESEGPWVPSDKVVRRAVDDLVDDWHRAGSALCYEDVTRLVTKRGLSAEQTATVIAALDECGVEIEGLTTRAYSEVEESGECDVEQDRYLPPDAVRAYLAEIGRYPLIWAEDEVRLGRQIQAGLGAATILDDADRLADRTPAQRVALQGVSAAGRRAHRELVCANLRLVVSIAKLRSYEGSGVEFIDRIQDGNRGLLRAADKFDPTLGYKFSTYATWWIRQAISRGIADRGRLIRLPVHLDEKVRKLHRSRRQLAQRLDREPTLVELAGHLQWPAGTVQALLDWSQPVASLDVGVGTEGDTTLGDLLTDQADIDGRTDPVDCVVASAWARDLDDALDLTLDARSKEIIRRRYGLHGAEDETLDEIGKNFGVTRERIRQLESKALKRLAERGAVEHLWSYLVEDLADKPRPPRASHAVSKRAVTRRKTKPELAGQRRALDEAGVHHHRFLYETIGEVVDAS